MKIGFIGLGKMGSQIVRRLLAAQIQVVVYDVNQDAVNAMAAEGAVPAVGHAGFIERLDENPIVWMMIPSEHVDETIAQFAPLLPQGTLMIDGGNSNYKQTIARSEQLAPKGIEFMDIGTSGGVLGQTNGFSMMVGGRQESYDRIRPALDVLSAPSGGHAYMGPVGYGHYVKMIHNGVEYGMMQAYAEGYHLLNDGPLKGIPLATVAAVWQRGSIINSTLNQLVNEILTENPTLDGIDGYVADSGEGRWTIETAQSVNISMPVLSEALLVRFSSQQGQTNFATKMLAAMRNKFGGHAINK